MMIKNKLEIITKLLGAQLIAGKDYREQVQLLTAVGVSIKEIAELTGKTENNVTVTLHLIKKAIARRKRK